MQVLNNLLVLLLCSGAWALWEETIVSFESAENAFEIQHADILIDSTDPVGVEITAKSLSADFEQITGSKPRIISRRWSSCANQDNISRNYSSSVIIIATVESHLARSLEKNGKADFGDIRGKWETFQTLAVDEPLRGVQKAFVIVGSDKRGTMFGAYTLAEQSGQSPLHWWADVPATTHDKIFALNKTVVQGEPSVKYRGLFINDEAPALTGWWAKRSNSTDYTFNAEFYEHVFDLLVRLKANFIWPAMWGSFVPKPGRIFFTDDPRNIQLADDYGIVVSTSHHEPMQRASNEWTKNPKGAWDWVNNKENVVEFMADGVERAGGNESYFTLGMRGANDGPIQADDPIQVLEDVFKTERELLAREYGNQTGVNQVWTVYKEVATYYAAGLVPPDDVTLMFTDDNWGNVQRLPTKKELERSGGIGLYYHFEYVGRPKSWKWQNCNNLPKVFKELSQAYQRGADRIWVMNVADIKPMEVPFSMSMDMAWNASRFDFDNIQQYLTDLAARDFGSEHSEDISSALLQHSHLVGMRKFELTEPVTYSILNFREAERVLQAWQNLASKAQEIHQALPEERKDALYHLLVYPAVAGYNYHKVVIGQGLNRQYGFERRNSANRIAQEVLDAFDKDYDLVEDYNSIANGKWEGIMSTPKFDMSTADWRPSSRDVVSNLSYVQLRQSFDYGFGDLGIFVEQSRSAYQQGRICASINPSLPTEAGFSPVMRPLEPHGPASRFIDLFHRGNHQKDLQWSVEVPVPWLKVSKQSGTLSQKMTEERIEVSVDWDDVLVGFDETIKLEVKWEPAPYFDHVHIPVRNRRLPAGFVGFPETDNYISIEAPHFQRTSNAGNNNISFTKIPGLASRSESGSIAVRPYLSSRDDIDETKQVWAEYDIYLFGNATRQVNATIYVNGALDTDPDSPMQFSLTSGDASPTFQRLLGDPAKAGDTPPEWTAGVANHVWIKEVSLGRLKPGKHSVRWSVNSPEIYLEKVVLGIGSTVVESYLGPPETFQKA